MPEEVHHTPPPHGTVQASTPEATRRAAAAMGGAGDSPPQRHPGMEPEMAWRAKPVEAFSPAVPPQADTATLPFTHIVVLHTSVDDWRKGQVVAVAAAKPGVDWSRLIGLRAVRPATPEESVQDRVTIQDEPGVMPTLEKALMDRGREVEILQQRLFEANEANRRLRSQPPMPMAPVPMIDPKLLLDKDRAIEDLRR